MRNLHLSDLVIDNFEHDLSDVKKIIRRNNQTAILAFNNVYFMKTNNKLVKLNQYPVKDVEWLQVRNVIFMWTSIKFEWYDVTQDVKQELDLPGTFECCAWNPSQGLLAVHFQSGKVQIIGFDFNNNTLVTVATNHGKEDDRIEDACVENQTAVSTSVVWNTEGDSFVIAFNKENSTVFEVYSEHCEVLARGEGNVPHLRPILAWQPDGCIIAALQENETTHNIVMFENNGLYKDILPLNGDAKTINFKWNNRGDVFAIHRETETTTTISLYSHRNYKWDLKQELCFEKGIKVTWFNWESCEQSHISLHVITSVSELHYKFHWAVDGSIWQDGVSRGTLAVIDGRKLRLTDIGAQLQPPPISSLINFYPQPINFVTFSPNGSCKVVILSDNTAYISNGSGNESFKILLSDIVDLCYVPLSVNNFNIDDDMNLFFVKNCGDICSVFRVSKPVGNDLIFDEHVIKIHESNLRVTHLYLSENLLFIRNSENVLIYKPEDNVLIESKPYTPQGEVKVVHKTNTSHVFCLAETDFYYNKNLAMTNVSSYLICHDYIMISTTDEKLFCYELNVKDLQKLQNGRKDNIFMRPIPKGAILITAIPDSTSIVLQLERGDLEVIKPRILSVRLVNKLLLENKFSQAFSVVKYDRLNTDIIVDLNPEIFMENILQFVESFIDNESLNIFITGLQDENIVNKLYKNCIPNNEIPKNLPDKKKTVLTKLIETMKKLEHKSYLQSIITADIMLNTYEGMEDAVREINWGISQPESDIDGIFHRIVPMTSAENLLKSALSVQDFTLIQWIANKTQLDPSEYIPFFKELHKMEPNYKSYKINNYLKRYDLAFEQLIKCQNVENEIMQLLEKGNLYKLAVQKVSNSNPWYTKIVDKCAENLQDNKHFTEAGLLFLKLNKFAEAFECFINDENLEEFVNLKKMLKDNKSPSREQMDRLLQRLLWNGKSLEAAHVYDQLQYYEEGIALLISTKHWDEAMKYIIKYNRRDFIETSFQPALLKYSEELCTVLEQRKTEFTEDRQRLADLRLEKINTVMMRQLQGVNELSENFVECEAVRNADLDSLMSVLSVTTHTAVTNTSSSTTRRKKKLARKTQETRVGSVFENIALMRKLHKLTCETQVYAQSVRSTCMHLLKLDLMSAALRLHDTFSHILQLVENSSADIWPADFINPPNPINITAAVLRLNIEHLEPQFRFPPEPVSPHWKIYSLSS